MGCCAAPSSKRTGLTNFFFFFCFRPWQRDIMLTSPVQPSPPPARSPAPPTGKWFRNTRRPASFKTSARHNPIRSHARGDGDLAKNRSRLRDAFRICPSWLLSEKGGTPPLVRFFFVT
ncbi:hypothetical protein MAPG_09983 [Magnaporthiopsis poae ATCC 64411]|uniref:Uncharacterized protein n=1 Tax=Magnaporthiopsis poae (strain ATCC 64411 / 73-15) TaxID=644358 RepID=A0A0C4EBD5_MAGP6|nr:hypothetical protein MAPG_09983 [Magnaporthiopsis poae ATCC 64411]